MLPTEAQGQCVPKNPRYLTEIRHLWEKRRKNTCRKLGEFFFVFQKEQKLCLLKLLACPTTRVPSFSSRRAINFKKLPPIPLHHIKIPQIRLLEMLLTYFTILCGLVGIPSGEKFYQFFCLCIFQVCKYWVRSGPYCPNPFLRTTKKLRPDPYL